MSTVAVLGATGFVGSHVVSALERRGVAVRPVRAPRVATSARQVQALRAELDRGDVAAALADLRDALAGCQAVVNAAGVATATGEGDDLYGANALLAAMVARAAPADARVVHVSSAAVQGRRPILDESEQGEPFSPYSDAKALGEQTFLAERPDGVCYRPTSVHGPGRAVTARLAKLLNSPACSVAGAGDAPTPQVLVDNVADAAAFLAVTHHVPPRVVLHPWEGMTVAGLARVLGGREPRHVPERLARRIVELASAGGTRHARVAGEARRLEMLWFGQPQEQGWLTGRWNAPQGMEKWKELP